MPYFSITGPQLAITQPAHDFSTVRNKQNRGKRKDNNKYYWLGQSRRLIPPDSSVERYKFPIGKRGACKNPSTSIWTSLQLAASGAFTDLAMQKNAEELNHH